MPGISDVVAIAAGYAHSIAVRADHTLWTWGDNELGELGRTNALSDPVPGQVVASGLSNNVVAIAGGSEFTLAVTSNGQIYAWGDNSFGELGINNRALAYTNRPVLVAAHGDGFHSMAVTVNGGANECYGWGDSSYYQVGSGTTNTPVYAPAGPLEFYPNCIQLGTNVSFTAHRTGTLLLFFNDYNDGDNTGVYNVVVSGPGLSANVTVPGTNSAGVAAGVVSNGFSYLCTASGIIRWEPVEECPNPNHNCLGDPNGVDPSTGMTNSCPPFPDMCPFAYPTLQCYSLVGKIE